MLALAGWLLAVLGCALSLLVWQRRSARLASVARACHELRGPITAAQLGLALGARTGELSRDRLRAIELELARAGLALQDLAGASSGRSFREEVDIGRLITDSAEAWRASATAAGVELEVGWSGPPATVIGDRLRIAQATGNLIANAIEHGGGRVEVLGSAERDRARIEIRDAGPGLGAPLASLGGARWGRWAHNLQPRGHGLAIARGIICAHGGRLATAPSERGTRLVIELPALRPGRAIRSPRVRES